jgi:DNA processing protein
MLQLTKYDEQFSHLALSLIPGIGPKTFNNIKDIYQKKYQANPLEQLWEDIINKNSKLLPQIPQRLQNILNKLNFVEIEKEAQKALEWSEQTNNHMIFENDAHYPKLLQEISDPPPVLYVKGNLDILNYPQIAIVGARNMSRYGQKNASAFAKALAQRNIVITSGLARGIDTTAHQSAVNTISRTGSCIAVMGTGLNYIYPNQNKKLAEQILAQNGALISELPLDTTVNKINFPRRNRIISAMSIATLVIECSIKSGSLITARFALEQDKEVFTIPGPIDHPLSQGPHNLIQQGAKLVQNINDILSEMPSWGKDAIKKHNLDHKKSIGPTINTSPNISENINPNISENINPNINPNISENISPNISHNISPNISENINKKNIKNKLVTKDDLNNKEKHHVLLYIDYEITPIDVIIRRVDIPLSMLKQHIITLELDGWIKACPGGYIKLKGIDDG